MSERRREGTDCPIPPHPILSMKLCQPCVYFRGAGTHTEWEKQTSLQRMLKRPKKAKPTTWTVVCNWPRNGSEIWKPLDKPLDDYTAEEIKFMTKGA